ncbi:Zinc-binding alcohol dehydrogenase domain-containing protein 2-like [Plakobranchus ocellatus]|uniref:Zinc-binding alcohol dehydrogenase domain-containing protein 2-like n=1 Tax=Plakobranchus ocellatus TaxID=259542 RepID=A0AAV3Y0N9_9GAST|nr:Zinc-binding alcohol dehydrogenase domain-containing protein 2-like [Plakobranchus ocellatus]
MASRAIPAQMRQIMVKKLGNKFREVTEVVQVPVPKPGPKQALVRTSYVAINASDIMFSSGFYTPGAQPPFPAGLEAIGEIVLAGEGSKLNVGQNVVFCKFGSFSEYLVVDDAIAVPVPTDDPVFLNLPISGSTASIALEKVQLAKLAGCHVIGTCSTEEKAAFLKSIGCDRTVNYNKESLSDVLPKEYPVKLIAET